MKRVLLAKKHYKPKQFVLVLLFTIPFIFSSCSTDADPEETEAIANTTWRLEYIQAEEGNVFPDHEGSKWEPEEMQGYAYYLGFIGEDTVRTTSCSLTLGNYEIIPDDSIHINWTGWTTPRGPHCSRLAEFPEMVANAYKFYRKEGTLKLHVKGNVASHTSERSWAKSVLYFSRVTKSED